MNKIRIVILSCIIINLVACSPDENASSSTFTKIAAEESGIHFSNDLDETKLLSVFNYINGYTGGGVAIGDINNDGLQDVFLAGNMVSSKLYLNKGDMVFEDVTESAGTATDGWVSAVAMADVNADGWLDIYVCKSYYDDGEKRKNQCFINNGDGTFTDKAPELGIDDGNFSVAAAFFDYDLDGDLDLIVGNHPRFRAQSLNTHYNLWLKPELQYSSRLFRNDGGKFSDVTIESGILSYGFTLALITTDYDVDGYPDVFISIDHDEPDILFRNNGDGTFTNVLDDAFSQTSLSSMGVDAGDINNDVYPDLIVAEMLSEDHYREKVNMSMQNVRRFEYFTDTLKYKYYQMHNFLHLNNGDGTFSDISQMARVDKSDWSWSTLFMDFDHDGNQDLFVTNGLYKDVFHKDRKGKLDEVMNALNGDMAIMNKVAEEYSRNATQSKIRNYLFRNKGDLTFENATEAARLLDSTISTGAAYGDLDNDGDLDLVVNNIGEKSLLYRNNQNDQKYIRLKFTDASPTPVGSKVYLYSGDKMQSRELLTTRGFLSSCEPYVHFGMGQAAKADKIVVVWPGGKSQTLKDIKAGTTVEIRFADAVDTYAPMKPDPIFENADAAAKGLNYVQNENYYFDYDDQVLLPHRMSEYGPFLEVADMNGDGLEDLLVPGPSGQSTALFLQKTDGTFQRLNPAAFEADKVFEDAQAAVFDANGDGNMDVCISSTGYEFEVNSPMYAPRLYMGDGKGGFQKKTDAFGDFSSSGSCVRIIDFDKDGDMDVFIGGRDVPKSYPIPGESSLWENDGTGIFTNKTEDWAPGLASIGMVRDAVWTDFNGDNEADLLVVGEWMPIVFFVRENGKLINKTKEFLPESPGGWWFSITPGDFDGDGLTDYCLGNLGRNYKYRTTKDKPFLVYTKDFDQSGSTDIVLGTYYGDKLYPVRGRTCSSQQIPDIKQRFPSFEEYATADIVDVYGEGLNDALKLEVNDFSNVILYAEKSGKYTLKHLPVEAQMSPINGAVVQDVNGDNHPDLIVAGNLFQAEIETGRADAGRGLVLINKGDRSFAAMQPYESGVYIRGDVKSLKKINTPAGGLLVAGKNRDALQVVKRRER